MKMSLPPEIGSFFRAGSAALLLTTPCVVWSQNAASRDSNSHDGLEEIIVTAERRAANMQTVPVAVTAISADSLKTAAVDATYELQAVVPGFVYSENLSSPLATLRGIGSVVAGPQNESHIPTYVDSVYYGAAPGALFSFANIERIEVLRGPQGTLFGRNSTGGLINVITKKPSQTLGGSASVGYGNFDTTMAEGYITGGLTDNLAADLAVYYSDQGEGWGKELVSGQDMLFRSSRAARTKWLLDLDQTNITLAADYSELESDIGGSVTPYPGSLLLNGTTFSGGYYDTQRSLPPLGKTDSWNTSLNIQHEFSWAKLVSISAYGETVAKVNTEQDFTASRAADFFGYQEFSQFSQELQLQSNGDGAVNWIAGVFYMDRDAGYDPLTAVNVFSIHQNQNTRSIAGFGQVDFPILERTTVTLGARYTKDYLEAEGYRVGITAPSIPAQKREADFAEPTWRLALNHRFSDEVMGYVSYNRGYKSGFYGLTTFGVPPVGPEILDAYEIGLKSDLFDRRVRLNASVFAYDYSDIQVVIFQGTSTATINAAAADVQGLDLELTLSPMRGLTVTTGAEWLWKRTYSSFPGAVITIPNPSGAPFQPCTPGVASTATTNCQFNGDVSGNYLPKSAELSLVGSVEYVAPVGYGDLGITVNANYLSTSYFDIVNRLRQDAYTIVNSTLTWTAPDQRYNVSLWAKNLLDKEYLIFGSSTTTADVASPGAPRTFGVSFGVRY